MKFLLSRIGDIKEEYSVNNWKLIHDEMKEEFSKRVKKISEIIYSTKTTLLRGIENMKNKILILNDSLAKINNQEKHKILHDFIDKTNLHICVTTPNSRKKLMNFYQKQKNLRLNFSFFFFII